MLMPAVDDLTDDELNGFEHYGCSSGTPLPLGAPDVIRRACAEIRRHRVAQGVLAERVPGAVRHAISWENSKDFDLEFEWLGRDERYVRAVVVAYEDPPRRLPASASPWSTDRQYAVDYVRRWALQKSLVLDETPGWRDLRSRVCVAIVESTVSAIELGAHCLTSPQGSQRQAATALGTVIADKVCLILDKEASL